MRRVFLFLVPALWFAAIGVASPSFAATATPVVTTYTTLAGAPQQVAVNGTLSFSLSFTEQSDFSLRLLAFKFEIHSACSGCDSPQTAHDAVTFLDPRSGRWNTAGDFGGAYVLGFHNGGTLKSNQQLTVSVRANLSSVPAGSYVIADSGAIVSNPVDSQGHPISVSWNRHDPANHTFAVGSVVAPSATPTAPKPSSTKKPERKPSNTVHTAPASVPPSIAPSSPMASTVAAASPIGSTPPLTDAASTSFDSGFSAETWLIALIPIVILIGFVLWRYRQPRSE